jgi:hypothetical protein
VNFDALYMRSLADAAATSQQADQAPPALNS